MSRDVSNPMPWAAERPAESCINPNRVGILLDDLEQIIAHLDRSKELQSVFGTPVSRSLVLVADENDLRIEDAGRVTLNQEQTQTFLRVLDAAINERDA